MMLESLDTSAETIAVTGYDAADAGSIHSHCQRVARVAGALLLCWYAYATCADA